jgi:glycosyltransferase involved in cell wall biosynthesis
MKVIIATTVTPFVEGGATYFVDTLEEALIKRGHRVETYRLPFSDDLSCILDQSLGMRLIDFSPYGDRLITIRTPSHLLRHPNKVTWFIHHFRGAYDLWGTRYQSLPNTPEGDACRQAIVSADNVGLREAQKVFCNSAVVKRRLHDFNQIDAGVLYPPLSESARFHCAGYGNFLLYLSRLTHHKRQWLALESLQYTTTGVQLVIAGSPEPSSELYPGELRRLIQKYKLSERVTLLPRWITDAERLELYANCLGVLYFPFDEDSYGYPSLEAHSARKPVLTTTDSGGTLELIVDGVNGIVTPPDPQLMAESMDLLYSNRQLARRLGENGLQRMDEMGIGWDHVVHRLLS